MPRNNKPDLNRKTRETRAKYRVRTRGVETTTRHARKLPLRFEAEVQSSGKIELQVPFPKGTRIAVFLVQDLDASFADLLTASQSSLAFWDNPIDDAEWNNA